MAIVTHPASADKLAQFDALPRRIFLDSCTIQTLHDYAEFISDGGAVSDADKIRRNPEGYANLVALRAVCMVTSRAQFSWLISENSWAEALPRGDRSHLQWLNEIQIYSRQFSRTHVPSIPAVQRASRLASAKFGYLGAGDRSLLQDAIMLGCDSFLTMERRLPRNSGHLFREVAIRVMTPNSYWDMLRPWAALWY